MIIAGSFCYINSDFICFRHPAKQKFLVLLKFGQKGLLNLIKFYRLILKIRHCIKYLQVYGFVWVEIYC